MGPFESWLHQAMESKGVLSIGRLSRETGLEALRVGDWATGRKLPEDEELDRLSAYFGVARDEIEEHVQLLAPQPRW